MSLTQTAYRFAYEIAPITLVGGVAAGLPGGVLPLLVITEALNLVEGLMSSGTSALSLDNFFAHFKTLPGGQLVNNQIGSYPYANQQVAANAIIVQPLTVSLEMLCPVKSQGGYIAKSLTMAAITALLAKHSVSGGTYTVLTPAKLYTGLILTELKDISGGESKQMQFHYQWDFVQPLTSLSAAAGALNNLTDKINSQVPVTP